MSHSFSSVWVHFVWSTKNREPLIRQNVEKEIHNFVYKQFEGIGCKVSIINGTEDHLHCLVMLSPKKSQDEIIKQVKGSTSHWINSTNLIKQKFSWQVGYSSFSVSKSVYPKVLNYIKNQKTHHLKKTFAEEYAELIAAHKFQ